MHKKGGISEAKILKLCFSYFVGFCVCCGNTLEWWNLSVGVKKDSPLNLHQCRLQFCHGWIGMLKVKYFKGGEV